MTTGGRRVANLATLTLSVVVASGCSDASQNDAIDRVISPDRKYEAVLFQRDCGATTAFSTQVSIIPADGAIEDAGNAFVADDDHGKAAAGSWGGPRAEVRWRSSNELLVRYAEGSRIFEQEASVSGVEVEFEAVRARSNEDVR